MQVTKKEENTMTLTLEAIKRETTKRIENARQQLEAEKASETPDAKRIQVLETRIKRLQANGF